MVTKAQNMKDLIDVVQNDMYGVYCDFDFKHGCLKQMKEINTLQVYRNMYTDMKGPQSVRYSS